MGKCNCEEIRQCECEVRDLSTDCIILGQDLPITGSLKNTQLSEVLKKIEESIERLSLPFKPKGEFTDNTVYSKNDLVVFNGSGYVSVVNENTEEPVGSLFWKKIVDVGPQGPKGDTFVFEDLTDENKFDLASRVPANGIVEEGNTNAISGGEVFNFTNKSVNTISDLRSLEGKEGQVITLLGYYEKGDKEPLNYKYTTEQGVDDGGSVINSGNGSWEAVFGDFVSFIHFGINDLNDNKIEYILNNFKNIQIPDDLMISINRKLNVNNDNIKLYGNKSGFIADSFIDIMLNINSNNADIEGVIFDGNQSAEKTVVLIGDNPIIRYNTFKNNYGVTSAGVALTISDVNLNDHLSTSIRGNLFENISAVNSGTIGSGVGSSRAIVISANNTVSANNKIEIYENVINGVTGLEGDAIQISNIAPNKYLNLPVEIRNNKILNFNRRGVKIQASGVTVSYNIINTIYNDTTAENLRNAIEGVLCDNVTVNDNIIDASNYPIAINISATSSSYKCKNVNIYNNNIKSGINTSSTWSYPDRQRGIYLGNCIESKINNNVVSNGGSIDISSTHDSIIQDNVIKGTGSATDASNGITVDSSSVNIDVLGNKGIDSIGSAVYFITLSGTKGYVLNNSIEYPPSVRNYSVISFGSSAQGYFVKGNKSSCSTFKALNIPTAVFANNYILDNYNSASNQTESGKIIYVKSIPTNGFYGVGDIAIITNLTAVTNKNIGWYCVTPSNSSGSGSVWKEIGLMERSTAVENPNNTVIEQQSASTATDITALVTNFNELVRKYNTAVTVINSLRDKLISKLQADRSSGQQAT